MLAYLMPSSPRHIRREKQYYAARIDERPVWFLSNLMTTHAAMFETLRMNLFRFCWAVRNPPATAFSAYGHQRRGWRLLIRGTRQEKIL
jgi:hypothetical protein